jgi:hypothetical protein
MMLKGRRRGGALEQVTVHGILLILSIRSSLKLD